MALLAIYYASFAIAVSSFATRRIVAAAALLIILLVTSIVAGVLTGEQEGATSVWAVVNLLALPLHLRDVVFEGGPAADSPLAGVANGTAIGLGVYLAVLAASWAVLWRRYRWVEA